jgi:radical SAM superfamily enzyme YgiQ (UPF0313 family)
MAGSRGRVLLFNPATWRGVGDRTAPWGLLGIAASLLPTHEVLLLDQRFDTDWRQRAAGALAQGDVVLAGATAMTGLQLRGALDFLGLVKSVSDVRTVLGGVHASMLPRETVAHPAIDFVVVGEGENVVSKLVSGCGQGASPPNAEAVVAKGQKEWKYSTVEDLDSLPRVPLSLCDLRRYLSPTRYGRMLSVVTSRGCPHGCAFCIHSNPGLARRWRGMSAEAAVDLMTWLSRTLEVQHFHIQDDNFFASPQRVEGFVRRLRRNRAGGPTFTWTVGGAHVKHLIRLGRTFFREMKEAGCERLLVGAESGSERVLARVGKRQSTTELLLAHGLMLEAGIRPIYSFISGVPDEEDSDLQETVRLMALLRSSKLPVDVGTIKPLVFYPGTKLYAWAIEQGYRPPATVEGWTGVTWDHYLDLPYPWLTQERRLFLLRLYYTSLMWNPDYHWVGSPLFTALSRAMMPITDWRMQRLDFRLSPLPEILRLIQHYALPVP